MRAATRFRLLLLDAIVVTAMIGVTAVPAHAQANGITEDRCGSAPAVRNLFTGTVDGFRHLTSKESLGVLALGAIAAAGAHPVDREVTEDFAHPGTLRSALRSGAYIGGTPLELSAAFATYGLGRALHHPCAAAVGADLVRAQFMSQALTIGIKESGRRSRPAGGGFSFPSGHTAATFATATVLQRHFGWKVGIPAYGVAAYVAASRVQMERHYVSDVVFGAAVGIVAGRSVTVGSQRFVISPTASRHGAGVSLSWVEKR